jgi:hypothetical protein
VPTLFDAELDERYPEPPLLPADAAERALARLLVERFNRLSSPYYRVRRGDADAHSDWVERLGHRPAVAHELELAAVR